MVKPQPMLLLLLALLTFPICSLADVGIAAFYKAPYMPTACYGDDPSQFPTDDMFAAAGEGIWDNGASCGRQYFVRCISASIHKNCKPEQTIRVQIVDRAQTSVSKPSRPHSTFVLSTTAYGTIADLSAQSVNIEFQQAKLSHRSWLKPNPRSKHPSAPPGHRPLQIILVWHPHVPSSNTCRHCVNGQASAKLAKLIPSPPIIISNIDLPFLTSRCGSRRPVQPSIFTNSLFWKRRIAVSNERFIRGGRRGDMGQWCILWEAIFGEVHQCIKSHNLFSRTDYSNPNCRSGRHCVVGAQPYNRPVQYCL